MRQEHFAEVPLFSVEWIRSRLAAEAAPPFGFSGLPSDHVFQESGSNRIFQFQDRILSWRSNGCVVEIVEGSSKSKLVQTAFTVNFPAPIVPGGLALQEHSSPSQRFSVCAVSSARSIHKFSFGSPSPSHFDPESQKIVEDSIFAPTTSALLGCSRDEVSSALSDKPDPVLCAYWLNDTEVAIGTEKGELTVVLLGPMGTIPQESVLRDDSWTRQIWSAFSRAMPSPIVALSAVSTESHAFLMSVREDGKMECWSRKNGESLPWKLCGCSLFPLPTSSAGAPIPLVKGSVLLRTTFVDNPRDRTFIFVFCGGHCSAGVDGNDRYHQAVFCCPADNSGEFVWGFAVPIVFPGVWGRPANVVVKDVALAPTGGWAVGTVSPHCSVLYRFAVSVPQQQTVTARPQTTLDSEFGVLGMAQHPVGCKNIGNFYLKLLFDNVIPVGSVVMAVRQLHPEIESTELTRLLQEEKMEQCVECLKARLTARLTEKARSNWEALNDQTALQSDFTGSLWKELFSAVLQQCRCDLQPLGLSLDSSGLPMICRRHSVSNVVPSCPTSSIQAAILPVVDMAQWCEGNAPIFESLCLIKAACLAEIPGLMRQVSLASLRNGLETTVMQLASEGAMLERNLESYPRFPVPASIKRLPCSTVCPFAASILRSLFDADFPKSQLMGVFQAANIARDALCSRSNLLVLLGLQLVLSMSEEEEEDAASTDLLETLLLHAVQANLVHASMSVSEAAFASHGGADLAVEPRVDYHSADCTEAVASRLLSAEENAYPTRIKDLEDCTIAMKDLQANLDSILAPGGDVNPLVRHFSELSRNSPLLAATVSRYFALFCVDSGYGSPQQQTVWLQTGKLTCGAAKAYSGSGVLSPRLASAAVEAFSRSIALCATSGSQLPLLHSSCDSLAKAGLHVEGMNFALEAVTLLETDSTFDASTVENADKIWNASWTRVFECSLAAERFDQAFQAIARCGGSYAETCSVRELRTDFVRRFTTKLHDCNKLSILVRLPVGTFSGELLSALKWLAVHRSVFRAEPSSSPIVSLHHFMFAFFCGRKENREAASIMHKLLLRLRREGGVGDVVSLKQQARSLSCAVTALHLMGAPSDRWIHVSPESKESNFRKHRRSEEDTAAMTAEMEGVSLRQPDTAILSVHELERQLMVLECKLELIDAQTGDSPSAITVMSAREVMGGLISCGRCISAYALFQKCRTTLSFSELISRAVRCIAENSDGTAKERVLELWSDLQMVLEEEDSSTNNFVGCRTALRQCLEEVPPLVPPMWLGEMVADLVGTDTSAIQALLSPYRPQYDSELFAEAMEVI